jgi:hypothetical protein
MKYWNYKRILLGATLWILLIKFPVFAERLKTENQSLTESGTRLFSELEVNELIDDLTKAAHEEIEAAAGEAAKAVAIAALEKQAALTREIVKLQKEVQDVARIASQKTFHNSVMFGCIGFAAGVLSGGLIIHFIGGL